MPDAPHFAYPMARDATGHMAEVEQDTLADAVASVLLTVSTELGARSESPDTGVPDWTFAEQPITREAIAEAILASSPRAQIVVSEDPDRWDALVDHITVQVTGARA